MYLKSIELAGFKSFAQKNRLDFNRPVTAIVGPNGSGKSNITEAFRFVLGEQSIKSMRGKKGEDLIWNGSHSLTKGGKASVKIIFDNRKKLLNVDFDEVSFERAVFRDGTNQYFLNGSQVRLKDIVEILAPTHIGPSGHHIISQGEADKILNAGSRDRREMIEDALGLRIYQYKKQESQKKLEKTEENIKQVTSLRKELSPHIRFLKRQFEKLQKTKEMRSSLLDRYLEFFADEQFYLKNKKEELENKRFGPEEKLQSLRTNLSEATTSLQNDFQDDKRDRLFGLEKNLYNLREEKDSLTRSLGRIEGQEASLQSVLAIEEKTQKEGIVIEQNKVRTLREEVSSFLIEAEGSQDLNFVRGLFKKILDKITNLLHESETEEQKERQENHRESLEKLDREKRALNQKIKEVMEREDDLSKLFKNLQDEIEKEKDVNRDLEKSIFRMRAEESELLSILSNLNNLSEQLKIEEENFHKELKEARVLVGERVFEYTKKEPNKENLSDEFRENRIREIEKTKIRLEDSGGVGEEVEKEYNEISERDAFLEKELADLENSAQSLKQLITDLESELDQSFKTGIQKINERFNLLFSVMFDGGSASLVIVKEKKRKKRDDSLEELTSNLKLEEEGQESQEEEQEQEGLDIKISLPRKKIRGLEMLSGGERALTSIALIFAVSQVNPPPFLILDETDAALDEANSRRYGDMIETLTGSSQLILITHNRETMSRAGIIYGVTMGKEGFSKILSVAFEEAVTVAK